MGKIILIGGNVDKGAALTPTERKEFSPVKTVKMVGPEIFERLISEAKGTASRIEIITSASEIPFIIGREYKKALEKLNCKNVSVMHISSSGDADLQKNLHRLEKSDCVLFTGGDQKQLCHKLLNTKFLKRLKSRFRKEKDFLVSGTSAGAMALGKVMIAKDKPLSPFVKGYVDLIPGFNLIPDIIVDTHFIQRRRLSRLIEAVANYPGNLGIGLAENTAVFFQTPERVEVIGSNVVVLIDGSHISYNNIKKVKENQNICLQDVKLHVLPKGKIFSITSHQLINLPRQTPHNTFEFEA